MRGFKLALIVLFSVMGLLPSLFFSAVMPLSARLSYCGCQGTRRHVGSFQLTA